MEPWGQLRTLSVAGSEMAAEFVSRVGADKDSSSVRERKAKMASQSVACGAPNSMPTEEDEGEDFFSSTLVPGWGEIRPEAQNNRETKYVGSFLLFSSSLFIKIRMSEL
jgi:hypothetical protein